jgi:anti-anti-sigma regulatory factor
MQHDLANRIRRLAVIESGIIFFAVIVSVISWDGRETTIEVSIAAICFVLTGVMYLLSTNRYAEFVVYGNIGGIALAIALIEPLTAITGVTWPLFQLMAPIGMLILRRRRAMLLLAGVVALLFFFSAFLPIMGVLPVRLGLPAGDLLEMLSLHIITLAGLSTAMLYLRMGEQRAIEAVSRAHGRLQAQAEELSSTNEILVQQNIEQQRLLDLVTTLEVPAIQLAEGLLFTPIVGTLDSRRAQALTSRLLREVHTHRARQVIIDISGVVEVDTQVAHALLHTAQALRLLGCSVTLTGISATVATTITQLGISLDGLNTAHSPQEVLRTYF